MQNYFENDQTKMNPNLVLLSPRLFIQNVFKAEQVANNLNQYTKKE